MAAGGTTTLVNLLKVKSNDLLVGNGVTGTGSLRVTIASDNNALAVSQSGTWTLSTLTNVQQFNGTAISMKAASTAAAATDTSLVVALSPNTALPAGTNAIGKLTANTGVTIGAVEIAATQTLSTVTTVSTVTSLTQMNGQAIDMGTGVRSAGTQRVTIATDDVVPASQSGTWNINNLVQLGGTAIAMNTGVRSAGTQRVTIATDDIVPVSQSGTWNINALTSITNALPAGTNNIGDVDVLTLPSIPAGTNNIGDVDIASIAAGTNTIGKVYLTDGTNSVAVKAGSTLAAFADPSVVVQMSPNGLARNTTATALASNNAELTLALNGSKSAGFVITAQSAPTNSILTPYVSYDNGVNWVATQFYNTSTGDIWITVAASAYTIGLSRSIILNGGETNIKVVLSNWSTGSVTILLSASEIASNVEMSRGSDGTTRRPLTALQVAGWDVGNAVLRTLTIRGASTATNAADPSLVVALSPNSPLPAGTNNIGDVDVLTLPSIPTGTNSIGNIGTVSTVTNLSQLGGTAIAMNTGVRSAGTQRVTIATDDVIGTVTTVSTVTNLSQLGGTAIAMNTGVRSAGTQRVTIATDDVIGTVTSLTQFNGTAISMKAANVAPALADPALVVALSPNSQQLTTPSGVPSVATASTGGSLPASTTYFFKLVAVDAGSGTTIPGPEASIATAVGTATNTVTITWPPITGADSYQVWWATASGAQASYFPAPINLSTSGTLTNSYVFSTVTGTFSGTTPSTNTTSFVRQKAIQPVSGPLTDTQLRATAVPVSGSGNFTVTQATAANLNATVTGTVELGATSLAALENISVTVPGTVDLGTVSLTALETITVTSGTPNNFQSKVYGAVTTAAPAYTNATDNALSLTTSGALRVDGSAVTQPVSGTFWQATQPVSIAASVTVTGPLTSAQTLTALTTLNQFNGTAISMTAASTAAVAGDTALVVSVSPNTAVNLAADDVHDGVAGTTGVMVTGFASAATPTAVSADGDAARIWVSRNGAVIIDGYSKLGTATAIAAINGTLTLQLGGSKAAGITITAISTPVGITLTPQVSFDGGTTWTATAFKNLSNGDIISTITNPNLIVGYTVSIVLGGGASHVRVIALAYGSGSVTLQWSASESVDTRELFVASNNSAQRPPSTAQVGGWDGSALRSMSTDSSGRVNIGSINVGLPAGANVIGSISNVGTVTTVSTVTNLSQLGGTAITMKAASTAAAAGDTSLVVGLSPNSPLPAGTNGIGKLTANDGIDIGDVTVNNLISNGVYSRITDGTNTMPTGDAAARGIYHRITDGTNNAAVAAASTAAAATDPALVVAISPNNSVTVAQATAANLNATVVQATAANLQATVSIAAAQTLTTVSTVSIVGSLTQMNGQVIDMGTGVRASGTQRVTIATNDIVQTKATPDATGTYAGTNATTTVYATNLVIKASAGTVYMLSGYNSLATAQFIQLHNATALPADTSVPSVIFYVPGLSNFSFDFGVYGRFFSTGVVVCNSTTGPTKTIGAANCWFDAQFK